MDVSPIEVQKALHGMDYPAGRDELLDCARTNDADGAVVEALDRLPEQEYDGPNAVSQALAKHG